VHADYLATRYVALHNISRRRLRPDLITYALRFPLCTLPVLAALLERPTSIADTANGTNGTGDHTPSNANANRPVVARRPQPSSPRQPRPELPRRLFRQLSASGAEVLPLLRYLYRDGSERDEGSDAKEMRVTWSAPDADSHDGYALVRAVSAGAMPLVRFLLDHGASPSRRNALAVKIAIKRRDLALVRLLVEPPDACPEERRRGKRRRLSDRVQVDAEMLRLAVTCGAQDIAEYSMNEKGCVPDLETIYLLRYSTSHFIRVRH
jgi:hypothetical protein